MLDLILFIVFPYVAVFLAVFGSLVRYFTNRFSYSSLSSQLIEKQVLFWGGVPWHYGVIPILLFHIAGFAIPGVMAVLHGSVIQLYLSELLGKFLTWLALVGIVILIIRRIIHSGMRITTTPMDWVVLVLLFLQIFLGFLTSVFYRWGAIWFIYTVTPWVQSLVVFRPEIQTVTVLPLIPKLHFLNATLLIAIFPFTRLVHMVTFPITYLWRSFQIFIWNRRFAH